MNKAFFNRAIRALCKILFITVFAGIFSPIGNASDDISKVNVRDIDEALKAIICFGTTTKGKDREEALQKLQSVPAWREVLWEHMVQLTRAAVWGQEDEVRYQVVKAAAMQALRDASATRGALTGKDPLVVAPDLLEAPRLAARAARVSMGNILQNLACVDTEDTVPLIAGFLNIPAGIDLGGYDNGCSTVQDRVMANLLNMLIFGHSLKADAPDAKLVPSIRDTLERSMTDDEVRTPIPKGTLAEWRQWWQRAAPSYSGVFILPPDLDEVKAAEVFHDKRREEKPLAIEPAHAATLPMTTTQSHSTSDIWPYAIGGGLCGLIAILAISRRKWAKKRD